MAFYFYITEYIRIYIQNNSKSVYHNQYFLRFFIVKCIVHIFVFLKDNTALEL